MSSVRVCCLRGKFLGTIDPEKYLEASLQCWLVYRMHAHCVLYLILRADFWKQKCTNSILANCFHITVITTCLEKLQRLHFLQEIKS